MDFCSRVGCRAVDGRSSHRAKTDCHLSSVQSPKRKENSPLSTVVGSHTIRIESTSSRRSSDSSVPKLQPTTLATFDPTQVARSIGFFSLHHRVCEAFWGLLLHPKEHASNPIKVNYRLSLVRIFHIGDPGVNTN